MSMALRAGEVASGPRPLDLRRDLIQVTELIEEAFGPELDPQGWAALRELRLTARLAPLLQVLSPPGHRPKDIIQGFVWVEEGRVVGNVTVQPWPQVASRYVIANVAVKEAYRGRGIAKRLMHMALEDIRDRGGTWVVLQVRENNEIARGMYQRMGFQELFMEYRMRREGLPEGLTWPLPAGGELRPLYDEDWRAVRRLLEQAMPQAARWWHGDRTPAFRSGSSPSWQRKLTRWLGIGHKMRWGVFFGRELMGVLDVDVLAFGEHRMDILLHPLIREAWSGPLLAYGLRYLQRFPNRPISAVLFAYQHPALDALRAWGFESFVVLVNMRKRLL